MKIPKTKDVKNELVFVLDEAQNHGLRLRSAYEGRRLWEACKIAQDKERVREVDEKYPQFLGEGNYDLINDPDKLFEGVSIPYTARIKGVREKQYGDTTVWEGDLFFPPCLPITQLHSEDGMKGPLTMHSGKSLWNGDTGNLIHKVGYLDLITKELYPEIESFGYLSDPNLVIERNFLEHVRKNEERLESLATNEEVLKYLKDISKLYVHIAKFESEKTLKEVLEDPDKYRRGFSDLFYSETPIGLENIEASVKLKEKSCRSGIALCNEYFSEIK
jgi:hypothetical protein